MKPLSKKHTNKSAKLKTPNKAHSYHTDLKKTDLELQADKWQEYCSETDFAFTATFFLLLGGLSGMAAPAQGFLLSSKEPSHTNHCFSTRENPSPCHLPKKKPKCHRASWPGASSHSGKDCLIDNSLSSNLHCNTLPWYVLGQETREVVITFNNWL